MAHDGITAAATFRRWVKAQGLSAHHLALRIRVPLSRARQLVCGRYPPASWEGARLGDLGESYLATLRRALQKAP